MHEVDSTGYTTVSGQRRYIDRNLPTVEGTVDEAAWSNAVQGELITVIEHAGLTLRASGAADTAAGWDQLKEAIFESQAIDNDALAGGILPSKLADGISISKLYDGALAIDDSSVTITDTSSGTESSIGGTSLSVGSGSGGTQLTVSLYENGIHHIDAAYNSYCFFDEPLQFDISGLSWVADSDFGTKSWSAVANIATGRTFTNIDYSIYSANCVFQASGGNIVVCGVEAMEFENDGGDMNIIALTVKYPLDPDNFTDGILYIRTTHYPF